MTGGDQLHHHKPRWRRHARYVSAPDTCLVASFSHLAGEDDSLLASRLVLTFFWLLGIMQKLLSYLKSHFQGSHFQGSTSLVLRDVNSKYLRCEICDILWELKDSLLHGKVCSVLKNRIPVDREAPSPSKLGNSAVTGTQV